MRNVAYSDTAILTADGCVNAVGELVGDGCCPIEPCMVDPCSLMCSFVGLLPNGPLWDRAKVERMQKWTMADVPCGPACAPKFDSCASVVDYAIYSGYQLDALIKGPLWASLREADPATAVETLDSWLALYGWTNSWETLCRDKRLGTSPFECDIVDPPLDACDDNFSPIYVPPVPTELDNAVKRGIVLALKRLQMSPIKNICGINWVIEPLGAFLRPTTMVPDAACCTGQLWEICNLSDTIEAVPPKHCIQPQKAPIQAWFPMRQLQYDQATGTCQPTGADTLRIWPGIMAAQIIALSMMPVRTCETPIIRCASLGDREVAASGNFITQQYQQNGVNVPQATAWSFARGTSTRVFNAAGVYQAVTGNAPRFDHDPTNGNVPIGLEIEPMRTNRALQSRTLNNAPWVPSAGAGAYTVADAGASIFAGNLWRLTRNTTGDYRQNAPYIPNARTTFSFSAKRSSNPAQPIVAAQYHVTGGIGTAGAAIRYNFDTDDLDASMNRGTLHSTKKILYPNGEVYLEITFTPNNGGTNGYVLLTSGVGGTGDLGSYGSVQVEYSDENLDGSSRIATAAVPADRLADVLTLHATGIHDWTLTLDDGSVRVFPTVSGNLVVTQDMIAPRDHVVSYVAL